MMFPRKAALAAATMALLACAPSLAQDAPDGLYMMTRFWMNSGLETDAFLFRDGQVARGPAGDVEDFDFEAARAAAPDRVGAYELSDGTLKVVWGDGNTDEATFEIGDACFNWNAGLFCPARPFAVDALEGTYEGGASGSSMGYAANARTLTFTPDGHYTMGSSGSVSSETAGSEVSGAGRAARNPARMPSTAPC